MGILDALNVKVLLRNRSERKAAEFLSSRLNPVAKNFLAMFGITPERILRKEPRTLIPEAFSLGIPSRDYGAIIDPPYDATRLQQIYEGHWVVRTCIDKLTREVTRKGWHFEPLFETKCATCGTEYDFRPLSETCPTCMENGEKGQLKEPDVTQIQEAKAFLARPNPSFSTRDLLIRFTKDLLIFDDAYISETKGEDGREWWPEDARYISAIADIKGRLGGKRFCPEDEITKPPGSETVLYDLPAGEPCPKGDGGNLVEAGYVQRLGSQISAAFAPDEIMHTNVFGVGNRLFGTPKLWALQTQITAMALIDAYQREAFDKSKTPNSIFLLKGFAEDAARRIQAQYKAEKAQNLVADFWIPVPNYVQGKNDIDIVKIPGMELPLLSGSLAYSEFYFRGICYTYGVDPAAIGVETSGRLGGSQSETLNRGVSLETINDLQIQVSEAWDAFIKRRWPKITHWKFSQQTAHEEEEADLWEIKKAQMEAAKIAIDAGFDVAIGEDGIPVISGESTSESRMQSFKDQQAATAGTAVEETAKPVPFRGQGRR